ncbi:hypothetical protein N658DRAFT_87441 [Parathielavia hyrcaniae]|uniref:CFEM domain-containing protein n=1 Tax=Parathielavia hyrcaniae TaxID=113614 RepID=A0AAN6PZN2_9PEZI|nr:hypothetical protein N658DRAFT_87441 [Parathielavia hyrcaniae]
MDGLDDARWLVPHIRYGGIRTLHVSSPGRATIQCQSKHYPDRHQDAVPPFPADPQADSGCGRDGDPPFAGCWSGASRQWLASGADPGHAGAAGPGADAVEFLGRCLGSRHGYLTRPTGPRLHRGLLFPVWFPCHFEISPTAPETSQSIALQTPHTIATMKIPAGLLSLALASAVAAQGSPELPGCATSCADDFLTGGIGDCSNADIACICANDEFLNSIACCLVDVCSEAEQEQAVQFALGICAGSGVSDLPTAVVCESASSATSTAASTEASTEASTDSADAATTASESEAMETTAAPTTTASDATEADVTSTTNTGAGPRPTAGAGLGAIGGIVAALALL